MPRLPSGTDVQPIAPQRDTGVQAPSIPNPVEIVTQEAVPVAQRFDQIRIQQQNRKDTVDRSGKMNVYRKRAGEELERFTNESDLSDEKTQMEYGRLLSELRDELLNDHEGTDESRAILLMRLDDTQAEYIGKAAGIATKIGHQKVEQALDSRLSPIFDAAKFADPEDLEGLINEDLGEAFAEFSSVTNPAEEEAKFKKAAENVVMSRIDRYLINGDGELAESLLTDAGMNKYLTPATQRDVNRRIETVIRNKNLEAKRAESPIGKIRADEKAGLISKEDAEAAIKRETFIAMDKLKVPGTIVAATDLNPHLPNSYADTFLIQQPDGSLSVFKGADGTGDKATYFRQDLDDGTVAVYKEENNKPPVYVGRLTAPNEEDPSAGEKPIRTAVQARADAVDRRASINKALSERGLALSESRFEQSIKQNARSSEGLLRDDYEKRIEPIREQEKALDLLDVALSGDISGLDDKVITNLVSQAIAPTNVRALAELEAFKSFGDLSERIAGNVKRFFSGTRTESQLNQIRTLIKEMRDNLIIPAKKELEEGYTGVAIRSGLDPSNVIIKGKEVPQVTTVEEAMKLPEGTVFIDPDGIRRVR